MILETITFQIRTGMSREDVVADARTTLERWSGFPGLEQKVFAMADETTAMGVYLWRSRADADNGHDAEWFDRAEAHWGNRPERKLCDVLMVLDNRHDDVREFASEQA